MPDADATQPHISKCSYRMVVGDSVTTQMPKLEVSPVANSPVQRARLMAAPRCEGDSASEMIAWPGTSHPLASMKRMPDSASTAQKGSGPAFASNPTNDVQLQHPGPASAQAGLHRLPFSLYTAGEGTSGWVIC